MSLGQMRQSVFKDTSLTLFQSAINDQFAQIAAIPFANGNLIAGILVPVGNPTTVNHGLQKVPTGYFIISNIANAVVWNNALNDATTMILNASATTTVAIWVF